MRDARRMNQGMPPPKKGLPWWGWLLIAFGILALLGIGVVVAGVVWFNNNKGRLVEGAQKTIAEADAFAATHDQQGCMGEGLTRSTQCTGIMCNTELQVFVQRCLQKATPNAGICDGVPRPNEIMATANWSLAECQKKNRSDQQCRQLMQALPNYCNAAHRATK